MADEVPKLVTVHSEGGYYNIPGGKDQYGQQDDRVAIKKARETNAMGPAFKMPEDARKALEMASLNNPSEAPASPVATVVPPPVKAPVTKPIIKPLNDDGTPVGSGPLESDVHSKAETLVAAARAEGIDLRVTSRRRSKEEQAAIYAEGRDANGKLVDPSKRLTNAPPGTSNHETGRAFDVAIYTDGKPDFKHPSWGRVGQLGSEIGLSWGGNWKQKDIPHFEMDSPKATGAKTAEAGPDPIANVRRYDTLINKYADKYNVPRDLIRGMMLQESGGQTHDSKGNPIRSPQAAMGLMQIIPATWARMGGGDPDDPETNIDHGAKYMGMHLKEFGTPEAALAAYHQGEETTRHTNGKPFGPRTRQYVEAVMAHTAKFSLTASSQSYQSSTPQRNISEAAQANATATDPRLQIIGHGLRLKGKDPKDYAERLKNPEFVSQLYTATMQYAESLDPKLTMASGEDAYLKTLALTPSPNVSTPSTTTKTAEPERTWLPHEGFKEVAKQVVVGAASDMVGGIAGTIEDIDNWLYKADKKFESYTGFRLTSDDLFGVNIREEGAKSKPISQNIKEWSLETIGKPKSTTSAAARAIAGFLLPFMAGQKALKGAGVIGKALRSTTSSAGVTFTQDPDDPTATVAVEAFVRELWSENPIEGQGVIARYIDGSLPEDELLKRLAQRGLRAGEDTVLGLAFDGAIAGFKALRAGRAEKLRLKAEAAKGTPLSASSPPVSLTPEQGAKADRDVLADVESINTEQATADTKKTAETVKQANSPAGEEAILREDVFETSLSRDLEIRQTVREADDLAGELDALRDRSPGPPSENALTEAARVKKEANTLARELRHPVTDEALAAPTSPTPAQVAQDKVLTELTQTPDPARVLASNHNRYMQDLMKSGMKPDVAREYLTSLKDIASRTPETINLDPPAIVRNLENAVDRVVKVEVPDIPVTKQSAKGDVSPSPKVGNLDLPPFKDIPGLDAGANRAQKTTYNKLVKVLQTLDQNPTDPKAIAAARKLTSSAPGELVQVHELRNILRDSVEAADGAAKGVLPEGGLFPGVARLPLPEIKSIASDLVDAGGGMLKTFIGKLREAGLDTLATKAIVGAVLKGSAVGLVANELIDPTSSEAAAAGEPEKSDKVFNLMIAAIFGVSAIKLIKRRGVAKSTASDAAFAARHSGPPPMSSVHSVKPGVSPARIESLKPLSPEELADPMAIFEHTNPRFENIADPTDYKETLDAANDLFKDQPETARKYWLNTPLNSANKFAEAIGADPKELQAHIDLTNTPLIFSDQMKAIFYNSMKAKDQLQKLVLTWRGMPAGMRTPNLAEKIIRLHGVYGQLATGFNLARSDFGRGLNVMKQASDGRLLTLINEGPDAGDLIRNPESLERYMGQLLTALEKPGGAAAVMARKMVKPTFGGAISQAFMHSLLGTVQTGVNTLWSSVYRLGLNPIVRTVGAAAHKYLPDSMTGTYKAGTSPEMEEGLGMLASIITNFTTGVGVARNTFMSGDTMFLERGSSLGAMHGQSQFVREAFGPVPKIMDAIGGLVGMPNAGNVFNWVGSMLEVMGTRVLLTVDEFTQFIVHQYELDAQAIRASKDPNLNFQSIEARNQWMEDFKKNPPENVLKEIAYQKSASSYMNSLFDHRGGFEKLRVLTGHIENGMKQWPMARVVAPFMKTSVNVLQMVGELTPGLSAFNKEIYSTNPAIQAEAMGRMITGLGLAGLFTVWGAEGKVRGMLTNNPAYRSELENAGTPENSVDWGGRTWKINPRDFVGALLTMFGTAGAMAFGESIHDDELGAVGVAFGMLLNVLKDPIVVGAIEELIKDISPEALNAKIKKLGLVGAAVDTLDDILLAPMMPLKQLQDLRLAMDGQKRIYDTYMEKIKARSPGFSDTLAPETDILRRPRWAGSGLSGDSINNSIKVVTGVSQDKVTQDALSVKLITKQVHISDPRPTMEYGGVSVPLSKAEQQELRFMIGHPPGAPMSLHAALLQITNHPKWEQLSGGSGGQAETVIKAMVQQYTAVARQHFLARNESIQLRIKSARQAKNISSPPQQ